MRYRKLDPGGDYTFGRQQEDFWRDTPEAVAQAAGTRLHLWLGQWFLDTREGTDWAGSVLGTNTEATRDLEVQRRVLETPGVREILAYTGTRDPDTREFNVSITIDTIYGEAILRETFR